jgi:hypothetical protein
MPREGREAGRANDPVAGHRGVVAGAHDVADGARGEGAARDDAHQAVRRDATGWNPFHHVPHGARPHVHGVIMPKPRKARRCPIIEVARKGIDR